MIQFINKKNFYVKVCIYTNSLLCLRFIHSSEINYSSNFDQSVLERTLNNDLRVLQLIKYEDKVKKSDMDELVSPDTSYGESFPWFIDEEGNIIDYNKTIDLFNGVKLISQYLEKRYQVDKNFISDVKISEWLKIFENNDKLTVLDLYKHVGELYNKDKNSLLKDLTSENISVADNTANLTSLKPFGVYGDKTLNEIGEGLLKLNWEVIMNSTKVTVHAAPTVMNFCSYSLMIRGYMKYVHNRPYDLSPTAPKLEVQKLARRRNLFIFSIIGAPIVLLSLRNSSIGIKNMIDISFLDGSEKNTINKIDSSSFFLLLLSKINKKIPTWVKFLFNLILLVIVTLKLLGYRVIDLFIDQSLLKNIVYISFALAMTYQLLNLYLIHKFSTRKVRIPEVLPDFFINWLKEIEEWGKTKESIKEFKKTCYIEISIYLALMVILILIS